MENSLELESSGIRLHLSGIHVSFDAQREKWKTYLFLFGSIICVILQLNLLLIFQVISSINRHLVNLELLRNDMLHFEIAG